MGSHAKLTGIFGQEDGCGGCRDYAMNSNVPEQATHWTSVGPLTGAPASPWFLRETAFRQPDGDYVSGCWLQGYHLDEFGLHFNDAYSNSDYKAHFCRYGYSSYVCSSNDWGPVPTTSNLGGMQPSLAEVSDCDLICALDSRVLHANKRSLLFGTLPKREQLLNPNWQTAYTGGNPTLLQNLDLDGCECS